MKLSNMPIHVHGKNGKNTFFRFCRFCRVGKGTSTENKTGLGGGL